MDSEKAAISADSHISETEDCFREIDPAFEDKRPRAIFDEQRGAILEISDLGIKVPMGIICTAGRAPSASPTLLTGTNCTPPDTTRWRGW